MPEGLWLGSSIREGYSELPHGWGILNFNDDDQFQRLKYEGNMASGLMEGHGTLWWKDGSYYTGQFHNNMKDQFGAIFYANGDIFSGSWSEEKKNTSSGMYLFGQGLYQTVMANSPLTHSSLASRWCHGGILQRREGGR